MFDLDTLNYIKILALRDVIKPDEEYLCRRFVRWYSKTFFTPIEDACKVPVLDILQHYYEEQFELLDNNVEKQEEFHKIIEELTESEAQKVERLKKEETAINDDEAFLQKMAAKIKEQETANELKKQKETIKEDVPEISMNFGESNSDLEVENTEIKEPSFGLLAPSKKRK